MLATMPLAHLGLAAIISMGRAPGNRERVSAGGLLRSADGKQCGSQAVCGVAVQSLLGPEFTQRERPSRALYSWRAGERAAGRVKLQGEHGCWGWGAMSATSRIGGLQYDKEEGKLDRAEEEGNSGSAALYQVEQKRKDQV